MTQVFINTLRATEGREIDGCVRTPGDTYQDVRRADPYPGPDEIFGENDEYRREGGRAVFPNRIFLDETRAAQERESVFRRSWLYACRVEDLPQVGSVFVFDFLDDSLLITRVTDTEVAAYRNTCPHRGNQLRKAGSRGVVKRFFCPFHGATWNLDGSNTVWPFAFDFPHLDECDIGLSEVQVGVFQGFVFVRLGDDPRSPSFEEFIAPVEKYMFGWSWDDKHPVLHLRKRLNANWKLLVQAFNEGIHIPVTHPHGRPYVNVAGTQVEVLSDYITRQIGVGAVPGDTAPRPLTEYEVLLRILRAEPEALEAMGITPESDVRARDVLAGLARARYEAESGESLPEDTPTTALVDNQVFHLFPNTWIVHGLSDTGLMRAIPGETPDACYFDLIWFHFNHKDGDDPPAPEMILVEEGGPFGSYWDKETIGGTNAVSADQDTDNLEGQQRGLRANPDGVSIFSNYLESAIVHDLRLMDEFIARDQAPS